MIASVIIIVFSMGLLAYWLRYTCLLLLNEATSEETASFSPFSFTDIRVRLRAGLCDATVQESLDRDFAVLSYLISKTRVQDIESRLLVWDYRLMRVWCALARTAFPTHARKALTEMADVLAVLAAKLGEGAA